MFIRHNLLSYEEENWNPQKCTIEKSTDCLYIVIDHSLYTDIGKGTLEECEEFLRKNSV